MSFDDLRWKALIDLVFTTENSRSWRYVYPIYLIKTTCKHVFQHCKFTPDMLENETRVGSNIRLTWVFVWLRCSDNIPESLTQVSLGFVELLVTYLNDILTILFHDYFCDEQITPTINKVVINSVWYLCVTLTFQIGDGSHRRVNMAE